MTMRVRFAPSPTGYLHIGSLRTCLYDYLLAKKANGQYILRVEDTDQERLVEGATKKLIITLADVGIVHDEGPMLDAGGELVDKGDYGPYIQSERLDIYQKYAKQLIDNGHAYYCFCTKERLDSVREEQKRNGQTPKYDGLCRDIDLQEAQRRIAAGESHVVRLKLPKDSDVTFHDHIRGDVTFNTVDLDDQVLVKADGFPTYHLAVVVDDHLMAISHVIRGEEWVSSTPKHICLYDAFGWDKPEYIHLPLILNSEKKKLSKRHDDASVEDYLNKGYLGEALINFVALMGWSPEGDQEIMSIDQIIEQFSTDRLSKSPAVFDVEKLKWMNGQHIRNYDLDQLINLAVPFFVKAGMVDKDGVEGHRDWLRAVVAATRERVETLADFPEMARVFVGDSIALENDEVAAFLKEEHTATVLNSFVEQLEQIDELCYDNAKAPLKAVQQATGYKGKQLFMTVRAAISGQQHGVDLNDLLVLLGKERVLKRVKYTLEHYI